VPGAERDNARLELVLVDVDLGVFGRLFVGGVDDAAVVCRPDRVRDANEVAVFEPVGFRLLGPPRPRPLAPDRSYESISCYTLKKHGSPWTDGAPERSRPGPPVDGSTAPASMPRPL